MKYEMCKKIADAGYPQEQSDLASYWIAENKDGTYDVGDWQHRPKNSVYIPSLSELIEACGDTFVYLWKGYEGTTVGFYAGEAQLRGDNEMVDNEYLESFGENPAEAVANLWIALNTKEK